jgi:hypothetical protein
LFLIEHVSVSIDKVLPGESCQTRRATEGIEWISGREVELVVKKKN